MPPRCDFCGCLLRYEAKPGKESLATPEQKCALMKLRDRVAAQAELERYGYREIWRIRTVCPGCQRASSPNTEYTQAEAERLAEEQNALLETPEAQHEATYWKDEVARREQQATELFVALLRARFPQWERYLQYPDNANVRALIPWENPKVEVPLGIELKNREVLIWWVGWQSHHFRRVTEDAQSTAYLERALAELDALVTEQLVSLAVYEGEQLAGGKTLAAGTTLELTWYGKEDKMVLRSWRGTYDRIVLREPVPVPKAAYGTIVRHADFPSQFVPARHIDLWLPDGYDPNQRYAVIYLHDGQMLFDPTHTWNKQAWELDKALGTLGQAQACIAVGIWNIPERRHWEYFPAKALDYLTPEERAPLSSQQPLADLYLRFLVEELKPFIDQNYATNPEPESTFLMGSSMGGLISLYGLCEYPDVFAGAACLSTHLPLLALEWLKPAPDTDAARAFRSYLQERLPEANTRKLYFDHGDQTLDALYEPYQRALDQILQQKGYSAPHWITQTFPGESHSERSWAKRLKIPLAFLLA